MRENHGGGEQGLSIGDMIFRAALVTAGVAVAAAVAVFFVSQNDEAKKEGEKEEELKGKLAVAGGGGATTHEEDVQKEEEEEEQVDENVLKNLVSEWRAREGVDGLPPPHSPPPPPAAPSPLAGLTYAVKECILAPDMRSSFGNRAYYESCSSMTDDEDANANGKADTASLLRNVSLAPCINALAAAGAVGAGWAVMDEFAFSIEGTTGMSLIGAAGSTSESAVCPYNTRNPTLIPGGSSSGSASAVASGAVDFGLGTDTAGSVRSPAACCSIYGLRPTHGAISTESVVPMAPSLDTVGFFARNAKLMSDVGYTLLGKGAPRRGNKRPAKVLVLEDVLEVSEKGVRDAIHVAAAAARAVLGEQAVGYMSLSKCLFDDEELRSSLAPFIAGDELTSHADVWPAILEALRQLQAREFWKIHGPWISENRAAVGTVIMKQRIAPTELVTEEQMKLALEARSALRKCLRSLLAGSTVMMLPTLPMKPVKRATKSSVERLAAFRVRCRTILALCSLSGSPQLAMPVRSKEASAEACAGTSVDTWEPSVSIAGRPGTDLLLLDFALLLEAAIHQRFIAMQAASVPADTLAPSVAETAPAETVMDATTMAAKREKELGNAKFKEGDYRAAIVHYTAAISTVDASQKATVYGNRALAFLSLDQYDLAEDDCNKCLKLNPTSVKALMRRGMARAHMNRLEEALGDFQRVLQLEPHNRQAKEEISRMQSLASQLLK